MVNKKRVISMLLAIIMLAMNMEITITNASEVGVETDSETVNENTKEEVVSDMDKDGVNDDIEKLFNTDPYKSDTDEDFLSDYIEIYQIQTDPTLKDTDNNGINDSEEDYDGDGLSNIIELNLGTDLINSDTDNDGLDDGEEVNTYGVNPLKYDTDEDGLSDNDEILLGLNPLEICTDGVTLDINRTFKQSLDESYIDAELTKENIAIPSISGNVSGNINKHVSLKYEDIYALEYNRAVIGKQVYVNTDYSIDTDLQLHFDCTSEKERNEFLMICKYEDGEVIPCTTNKFENDIWTNVTKGYYFVVDSEKLLNQVNVCMEEYKKMDLSKAECAGVLVGTNIGLEEVSETVKDSESKVCGQADIVFVIDSTISMDRAIKNVVNNIENFADTLSSDYSVNANFALIDYKDITYNEKTILRKNDSSNWFNDVESFKAEVNNIVVNGGGDTPNTVIDSLAMASELDFRENANKFIILITDANYKNQNNYGITSMNEMISKLNEKGIVTSIISDNKYKSEYSDLYKNTKGIFSDIYEDFSSGLLEVADNIGNIVNDGTWTMLSDYQYVKLEETATVKSSSDEDSLSTDDELGTLVENEITPYVETVLEAYDVPYGLYRGETAVNVYKYNSNPVLVDTDFDGINDDEDIEPKNNNFSGLMHYELDGDNRTCNVEFSVDYRKFFSDNTVYEKDLAILSSLYASDIYGNTYIEVNKGASCGSDDATKFGELFGLKDVEDIKIKGANYSVDKDDETEFLVGHRCVEYNGEEREIIIISVRGTNKTSTEWTSNFDVGADTTEYYNIMGSSHPDWKNKLNHKGFDVAANRVLTKFNDYLKRHGLNDSNIKKSILITGHSRGAAIANLLGAHFEQDENYQSYTYTFAAPFCTTDSKASSYKTIKNIVNKDDIIPYLPLEKWGFKKYGQIYEISVEDEYEDTFGEYDEGTWEWLIGVDYDNDGGTQRTIGCFEKIGENREELYKLDTSSDGKVNIGNRYHTTRAGANRRLAELKAELDKYKLGRFCKLTVVGGGFLRPYHVQVNYCPAYLMQNLSNMACGFGPILGYDVKGVYAEAKASFALSSGSVPISHLGGMVHPHMQPTYYLIAHNNFESIK